MYCFLLFSILDTLYFIFYSHFSFFLSINCLLLPLVVTLSLPLSLSLTHTQFCFIFNLHTSFNNHLAKVFVSGFCASTSLIGLLTSVMTYSKLFSLKFINFVKTTNKLNNAIIWIVYENACVEAYNKHTKSFRESRCF